MNWQEGRQGTGYFKLPLLISERFKFDSYILKYPKGSSIPTHTDPAPKGKKHFRFNLTFWGDYNAVKLGAPALMRCWRAYLFRPDLVPHSVEEVDSLRFVLSIGWLMNEY